MSEAEKAGELIGQIWTMVEPVVQSQAMELIEVEYRRESIGWVLRLFVDKEDGVSVDDCARVSRAVGDLFDTADIIPNSYHLEVSSPGLDRPLRKVEHFREQIGKVIEARTTEPIENRKRFKGILKDAAPECIRMNCDGQDYEIPLDILERARLKYFDSNAE